jgi:TonB-linked SusC/RagA family outer membrane protein
MQIHERRCSAGVLTKIGLAMKLTTFFVLAAALQVQASGYGQNVTFSGKDVPLKTVFSAIRQQTGYVVFYDVNLLRTAQPVTVQAKDAPLHELLRQILQPQGLDFVIVDKTITLKKLNNEPRALVTSPPVDVRGQVFDQQGKPVTNVLVKVKGASKFTQTDDQGVFFIKNLQDDDVLELSAVNIEAKVITVNGRSNMSIVVKARISELDEVQTIAYGTTTQRMNTGSKGRVTAEEIEKQPVINVMQALQGRVPGLFISPTSGLGSATFNVSIRGLNSVFFASDPLIVIDGVPMMAGMGEAKRTDNLESKNLGLNQNNMVTGVTQSPLFSINPADIESVDVLKDADATAIYGSQGANGVMLITTKKGKPGKTKISANFYTGIGKVTRLAKLMNTAQYLELRREAYANDNVTPTNANAPDLTKWDQERYTDWQDLLLGNTARQYDGQVSISGGDEYTQYRISGGYHQQTDITTFSGHDKRGSGSLNLSNTSKDRRFRLNLAGSYSNANTSMVSMETSWMILPPNAPSIFDPVGKLNFAEWGNYETNFLGLKATNPFASLLRPYEAITDNLQSSLQLQYQVISGLTMKVSGGFSSQQNNQMYITPKVSLSPTQAQISTTRFGNNSIKTWIIEPQAEYYKQIGAGRLSILLGTTLQNTIKKSFNSTASDFSNEALLRTMSAAKTVAIYDDSYTPYRYQAIFGRINYIHANKYLLNVTGRRDGSSRFGPGRQFGNFGAIGAGWIFTEEAFVQEAVSFLSYGKLRGSYGATGSANIGDYNYLSRWMGNSYSYQNTATLSPTQHFNPIYGWEENKKLELAMELGFMKDRIQLIASWHRNRSDNQLVTMALPSYTGFNGVTTNLPAIVQNTGWEIALTADIIRKSAISWKSNFNIAIPRNKLIAYPKLEASSYANKLEIGKPLQIQKLVHFIGIDPETGGYLFFDANEDGKISTTSQVNDFVGTYNKAPVYFGGWSNNIQYKNWILSFFINFVKQRGFLPKFGIAPPGSINNQSAEALKRWQKPGDITDVAKATTFITTHYSIYSSSSDAKLVDASFARVQNLSIAYDLPAKWTGKYLAQSTRLYVQCQNLFTFTGYKGADPETQDLTAVPPVKYITAGIQITF